MNANASQGSASVRCQVNSLSNVVEGRIVLSHEEDISGSARFFKPTERLDEGAGFVDIITETPVGLFAWVDVPQLVNTVAINNQQEAGTDIHTRVAFSSGRVSPIAIEPTIASTLFCDSLSPAVNVNCTRLDLTGGLLGGDGTVQVDLTLAGSIRASINI